MKKIELRIETLRVDSFTPDGAEPGRGTVQGHANLPASGNSVYRPCFYTEQPSCTC